MPVKAVVCAALIALAVEAGAACTPVDHTHSAWTEILAGWVADGQVDYAGIEREQRAGLGAYLANLSGACAADYETWRREARIAFWINAYNAFTVRLILDHYPVSSIRKIGWLPLAAFRQRFIPMPGLRGGLVSLQEIENDILRAVFREPRIHFALVCAARSCPPLRREAYRERDLDAQLDEQTRTFLRDPSKNRVDRSRRTLELSAIFKWYRADFEEAGGTVQTYVAPYLDGVVDVAGFALTFLEYDWSLNDRRGGSS